MCISIRLSSTRQEGRLGRGRGEKRRGEVVRLEGEERLRRRIVGVGDGK